MFVLSCEPATCAVPEWHKEIFRNHEDTVTSGEGWSPGSLNLAQAFATKLRSLLAHGDITRLLIDFSKSPEDPARFSRFSAPLSDEQRRKLDERHHLAYFNLIKQRIVEEQRKSGVAVHLSIRTDAYEGMPAVNLIHDCSRDLESSIVRKWAESLRTSAPDLAIAVTADPGYGLSASMREAFPTGFGSVSLVVTQSAFLEGHPIRWEFLKKLLLDSLPRT